jgi:hypothetical protein
LKLQQEPCRRGSLRGAAEVFPSKEPAQVLRNPSGSVPWRHAGAHEGGPNPQQDARNVWDRGLARVAAPHRLLPVLSIKLHDFPPRELNTL